MKKLEVYLRVYFGIFPKANGGSEEQQVQAMSHLKNYFEENSGELSKDPTILPLFALPFVQDPKTHPVFKELLQVKHAPSKWFPTNYYPALCYYAIPHFRLMIWNNLGRLERAIESPVGSDAVQVLWTPPREHWLPF